jgi:hypothetical protein
MHSDNSESEKLQRNKTYPLADWYGRGIPRNVRAVWTGEKRAPRKGEYYLSGAVIGAYLAPSDLNWPYHIAKLVTVESKTVTRITGDYRHA